MAHLGLICPELSGHLNPMTTLGRELKRRGHRVTLIGRPDTQKKTASAGLEFAVVGERNFLWVPWPRRLRSSADCPGGMRSDLPWNSCGAGRS
jgi:hypothetical protein